MDTNNYLKRIKSENYTVKEGIAYLAYLQSQHMLNVPFENQDVMRGVPIKLDVESFFEKVVFRHRGGFCYELNGLFYWLLKELGYDCYLISGTVRKPDGSWALANSHAAMIVHIDQPYLVDVGFGDSCRKPVPINGESIHDIDAVYRVKKEKEIYFLQTRKDNRWVTLYQFSTVPKELTDFTPMCRYNQTSPDSRFTQESIATIATPHGRVTLLNNTLKIKEGQTKIEQKVQEKDKSELLKKFFGIVLDE